MIHSLDTKIYQYGDVLFSQSLSSVLSKKSKTDQTTKPNKSSAVAEMGDRLATIDTGRKAEAAVPLFLGVPI